MSTENFILRIVGQKLIDVAMEAKFYTRKKYWNYPVPCVLGKIV